MTEKIDWCIDHNVPRDSCTICDMSTCPVSIYSKGQRIIVGEARFEEKDGEQIAHVSLHQHMPNFLEAFREGIVTGLVISPERSSVQETYDRLMENEKRKSIQGETIQYKKEQ